jgi:hypothetical protein
MIKIPPPKPISCLNDKTKESSVVKDRNKRGRTITSLFNYVQVVLKTRIYTPEFFWSKCSIKSSQFRMSP